jgi:hypothetical protein
MVQAHDVVSAFDPAGTVHSSKLLTFGVGAQRDVDGQVFVYMPMRICLSIPRDDLDAVPEGTEVWM